MCVGQLDSKMKTIHALSNSNQLQQEMMQPFFYLWLTAPHRTGGKMQMKTITQF